MVTHEVSNQQQQQQQYYNNDTKLLNDKEMMSVLQQQRKGSKPMIITEKLLIDSNSLSSVTPQQQQQAQFGSLIESSPKFNKLERQQSVCDESDSDRETSDYELNEEDIEFIQANTGFTMEQIHNWYSDFLVKCPTGVISKKQFCTYYKTLLPSNLNDKSKINLTNKLFHLFDIDGDDCLNYAEFLVSFWIRCQAPLKEKFTWLFNAYDSDKNGVLDYTEIKNALTCCLDINILDELLEELNDENLSYLNKKFNLLQSSISSPTLEMIPKKPAGSSISSASTDDDDEAFYDDNSAFSSKSNFSDSTSSAILSSPTKQQQEQHQMSIQQQQQQLQQQYYQYLNLNNHQQQQYNIYSRTTKLLDDKLNELIVQLDRVSKLMVISNHQEVYSTSSTSSLPSPGTPICNDLQQQQQYLASSTTANIKKTQITRKNFVNLCVKYKRLRKLLVPIDYYYEDA